MHAHVYVSYSCQYSQILDYILVVFWSFIDYALVFLDHEYKVTQTHVRENRLTLSVQSFVFVRVCVRACVFTYIHICISIYIYIQSKR